MPDSADANSKLRRWLKRVAIALALVILCLASLLFFTLVEHPRYGPWRVEAEGYSKTREGSFARLLASAGVQSPKVVLLKVYLGWDQDVTLAFVDRPGIGPQILISEYNFKSRQSRSRVIGLTRAELNAFLSRFDDVAIGYRMPDIGGTDGREIAFERRLPNRIISYVGNASFSDRDAAMAHIVDQLIAKHGGYTWIRPDASGTDWTRTELGIPAPRP